MDIHNENSMPLQPQCCFINSVDLSSLTLESEARAKRVNGYDSVYDGPGTGRISTLEKGA